MSETMERRGRLAGRRVLVTGAASGIGKAIAELFAAEGAKLALVDVDAARLNDAAAPLNAAALPFDLSDLAGVDGMVAQAAAAMDGLDGVVNCAAYSTGGPIAGMTLEIIAKFTAVNLVAPYFICRAALPHMGRATEASIVNIASGQGLLPNAPNNTAYAATKGGLIAFTKALAAEVAPHVRVNAVCPGVTNTPMAARLLEGYDDPSDAPFVQQYALRRVAEPVEIARAVLFLCSGESSFVTGSALAVDGGRCYH